MDKNNEFLRFKRMFIKELKNMNVSLDIKEIDTNTIEIKLSNNVSSEINLSNIFKDYLAEKNKYMFVKEICDNILESFYEIVNKYEETEKFENFEDIKDNILPVIKSNDYDVSNDIVYRDYNEELRILYAIDTESSIIFIKTEDLENWKVKEEDIYDISIENLKKMPSMMQKVEDEVFVCIDEDGYTSSRLLLTEIYTFFEEQVHKELYLAIPTRDEFILFSENKSVETRRYIFKAYNTSYHPLTTSIFSLNKKQNKWHKIS